MARLTQESTEVWSRGPWFVSRRFDLTWVFGGAAVGLLAVAVGLCAPSAMVTMWWVWLLAFDGPHMMATYTRTYLDREAWKTHRTLLLGSLVFFALGPACLLLDTVLKEAGSAFLLFLGISTAYSYYHIVRQHYGFLALYKTRANERSRVSFYVDKWSLYAGCWLPYVSFLLSHPRARALIGLTGSLPKPITAALLFAWGGILATFVVVSLRTRTIGPKVWYGLTTILFHGLAYFVVAQFEPVYANSAGPDQDFLLLSVMLAVFHNIQYVVLVYLKNRSRQHHSPTNWHVFSRWCSESVIRFVVICLSFSVLYFALARATGVFPLFQKFVGIQTGPFKTNQLALALWWGLALHHYFIDQRIWRVHRDPVLREHLGLSAAS